MAPSAKTSKSPKEQASNWNAYFTSNPSGIINSTGYQLYAVNDQTVSGLTSIQGITSSEISNNVLNLQFADVAYNSKYMASRQRLSWRNTIQKNVK